MTAFIIRRILYTIPILFGVSLIVFSLFHIVGGDPALIMAGKHASAERIAEIRATHGLDKPVYIQYFNYLKQIATFDYGVSNLNKENITDMIRRGIGPSLTLTVPAFTIGVLIALFVSLLVSYYRGTWIDRGIVFLCVCGMSISSLAFILFGQFFLAFKFGWFPISGYEDTFPYWVPYIVLPGIIFILLGLGTDVRFYRTSILDETQQDYVRTARSKGLREPIIYFKHVLKNSLIPIITYTVIQIPFLILGSLLLENYFSIPGLGSITIDAINNADFPVIKAMTTLISILYILGQLVTDILYTLVDPRVNLK